MKRCSKEDIAHLFGLNDGEKRKAPVTGDKEILVSTGPRGGLVITYYVGEKKVSPFVFVKSENVDATPTYSRHAIGASFTSKLPFKRRVELNRQAREIGIPTMEIGYKMFLEKFKK